jgi:hypothetical protein
MKRTAVTPAQRNWLLVATPGFVASSDQDNDRAARKWQEAGPALNDVLIDQARERMKQPEWQLKFGRTIDSAARLIGPDARRADIEMAVHQLTLDAAIPTRRRSAAGKFDRPDLTKEEKKAAAALGKRLRSIKENIESDKNLNPLHRAVFKLKLLAPLQQFADFLEAEAKTKSSRNNPQKPTELGRSAVRQAAKLLRDHGKVVKATNRRDLFCQLSWLLFKAMRPDDVKTDILGLCKEQRKVRSKI